MGDLETIDAVFNYVQETLLEHETLKRPVPSETKVASMILLCRASSLPLTDMLEFLLTYLKRIESKENGRSGLVYNCLAIALENKHVQTTRILLDFASSKSSKCSSVLHCAAANGDVEIVTLLIESGVDVNQTNSKGETALHFACIAAVAEVFVANGADVNALTNENETPLRYACNSYRLGVIRTLLENGANPSLGVSVVPSHVTCDWNADTSIVNVLAKHVMNQRSYAFDANHEICLHNTCIYENCYPMCHSCKHENQPMVEKFLARKTASVIACPNYPPLQSAVYDFYREKLKTGIADMKRIELILSANDLAIVNALDECGTTALYLAVERNLIEVATLLLDSGANPNLTTSDNYPLVVACRFFSHEFVNLLLSRGADPNVADCWALSPVFIAAESLDHRLVQLLVEHGANVNAVDRNGRTALYYVIQNQRQCSSSAVFRLKIATHLIDNGCNVNQSYGDGKTALRVVIDQVQFQLKTGRFSQFFACIRLFDFLLEREADVNVVVSNGYSALCDATRTQNYYAVRELLRHGAWNSARVDKSLTIAVINSEIQAARLLLAAGADPNLIVWDRWVWARLTTRVELLELLMNNGMKFGVPKDDVDQSWCEDQLKVFKLKEFLFPCCKDTECFVLAFKAGSNLKFLSTCCRYNRKKRTQISCGLLSARLCKAIVLAGQHVEQQELIEMFRRSERRHYRDLASWLEEDSTTPPSLTRQSRTVIRRQLSIASGDRTILPLIDVLSIPNQLRLYLKFEGPYSEIDLTAACAGSSGFTSCICEEGVHRFYDYVINA